MHLSTVSEWLEYLGSVHRCDIELGLDRVRAVAHRLDLLTPFAPVIIVGGTNGKGSTVAGLNAIYRAAGFHVGTFTSPYLIKHNEEVMIDDVMASDEAFCTSFATIERARGDISLTPFEFHTLAALLIFRAHPLDVIILEVGLGGRLDAVNIIDADVAIVASVDIDHIDWLGKTREAIGREKAGIFRSEKPAICGDFKPPETLLHYAREINAPLFCQNKDFYYSEGKNSWAWHFQETYYENLPQNALATQNMSSVLMALTLLQKKLPVTKEIISKGLTNLSLPGRVQIVKSKNNTIIFDVAHNPAACAYLAKRLKAMAIKGKIHAVFSMLYDKEISASIYHLREIVNEWYIAALSVKRAASSEILKKAFQENNIQHHLRVCETIEKAFQQAMLEAQKEDAILVFGSFYTVSSVSKLL